MELFRLPNFHHELFLVLLLPLLLLFFKREKRAPKDIYELSMELQRLAPNDPKVQELLRKLSAYKYRPSPKPIPKKLYKELLEYHKLLRKKRYNSIKPLQRIGYEKVATLFRSFGHPFRRRL